MKLHTPSIAVAAALAAVLVVVAWFWSRADQPSAVPVAGRHEQAPAQADPVQPVPTVLPSADERSPPRLPSQPDATPTDSGGSAATTFLIGGVVLDEAGLPILDAEVFIGAEKNPFDGAKHAQWGEYTGLVFSVGANGEFHAELPSSQSVFVCADSSRMTAEWISELESQAWVTPPREDLVLRLRRVPYGTVVVRVHDGVLGADLEEFAVSLSSEGKSFIKTRTTEGVCEIVVPKIPQGGRKYAVTLVSPKTETAVKEAVRLAVGETRSVVLQVRSDRSAGGVVTDFTGAPIEGVLVYFGDLTTILDEIGDAPDPGRADGVLTDSGGQFQLSGGMSVVSFWHPRYQPRTLPASQGMNVALGDRGRIVVHLEPGLDPRLVRIDEETTPELQPDGSVVFENVAAGFHPVQLPGGELLSVTLVSNETVEIGQEHRVADVVLRLYAAGSPLEGEFSGALFGLAPVASLVVFTALDGMATVGAMVPGDYLLCTFKGHASIVSIDRAEVSVDVGEYHLTVRSASGGEYFLMPLGASALPHSVRNQLARSVAAEIELGPLPPGLYVLTELRSGHEWKVELEGSRVLDLP